MQSKQHTQMHTKMLIAEDCARNDVDHVQNWRKVNSVQFS